MASTKEISPQKNEKPANFVVDTGNGGFDYDSVKPVWQTQRKFAEAKISEIQTNGPSTGDPNSPFNLRVNERHITQNETDRQRPAGRPSSTRITAKHGVGSATVQRVIEAQRGAKARH